MICSKKKKGGYKYVEDNVSNMNQAHRVTDEGFEGLILMA